MRELTIQSVFDSARAQLKDLQPPRESDRVAREDYHLRTLGLVSDNTFEMATTDLRPA